MKIFIKARYFFTNYGSGQSSDAIFNLGIYGSGSINSIVYNYNDQYEDATGWLNPSYSAFLQRISVPYMILSLFLDGQSYDYHYEGEHRPINPASLEFDGGDWDDDYVSFGDILDSKFFFFQFMGQI